MKDKQNSENQRKISDLQKQNEILNTKLVNQRKDFETKGTNNYVLQSKVLSTIKCN